MSGARKGDRSMRSRVNLPGSVLVQCLFIFPQDCCSAPPCGRQMEPTTANVSLVLPGGALSSV